MVGWGLEVTRECKCFSAASMRSEVKGSMKSMFQDMMENLIGGDDGMGFEGVEEEMTASHEVVSGE